MAAFCTANGSFWRRIRRWGHKGFMLGSGGGGARARPGSPTANSPPVSSCVAGVLGKALFPEQTYGPTAALRPMTVDACWIWCVRYPWIALHHEICECGFGPIAATARQLPGTACQAPCEGNGSQVCGGGQRGQPDAHWSVYRNRDPALIAKAPPPNAIAPHSRGCRAPEGFNASVLAATVITKNMGRTCLSLGSALVHGLDLHVFGFLDGTIVPRRSAADVKRPHNLKLLWARIVCYRQLAASLAPNTTVVFMDGTDTVFNSGLGTRALWPPF